MIFKITWILITYITIAIAIRLQNMNIEVILIKSGGSSNYHNTDTRAHYSKKNNIRVIVTLKLVTRM